MGALTFQYPEWYLLLCGLLAVAISGILYYRDNRFRDQPSVLRAALAFLRFSATFIIAALLLTPLLNSTLNKTRDPIVVFVQDASSSVAETTPPERLVEYRESLQTLLASLENRFQVDRYTFGNKLSAGGDDEQTEEVTNISGALTDLYDLYSNQNVGAVIMATDGIYNRGSNPLYVSKQLQAPLFTIGLGDTTEKRDLVLRRVFNNRIAYLGDRFTVEVDVQSLNCRGEEAILTVQRISRNSPQTLSRIPIRIDDDNFFETHQVILDADEPGMQRYRIALSELDDEASTANNARDIFIDVLDARQTILILAESPHPDVTALRQAISVNRNYEVEVATIEGFEENLEQYDLVILHQIPGVNAAGKSIVKQLDQLNIPRWHILGLQSDFTAFSEFQNLVQLTVDSRNTNDVQAAIEPSFSLFTLDDELVSQLPGFAPLLSPFGDYKAGPSSLVMLWQRIGKIDTKYPLLVFGEENGNRAAILTAEGLWKWRLFDFLKNGNHNLFEGLIGKTVQYLSVKDDKRRFRVEAASDVFPENEPVVLNAELYNASYELVNQPDASLRITNEQGEEFDFAFNRSGKGYSINAGFFPMGNYSYVAEVTSGDGKFTTEGRFSVEALQLEAYETNARHSLLRQLSKNAGGAFFTPQDLNALNEQLGATTLKPVVYQTEQTIPLTYFKWVFVLLFFLLALEWFLRRFYGSY